LRIAKVKSPLTKQRPFVFSAAHTRFRNGEIQIECAGDAVESDLLLPPTKVAVPATFSLETMGY